MSYTQRRQKRYSLAPPMADEWGLAIVASRTQNGERTITPAVFATAQSSTFQPARGEQWRLRP